MSHLTQKLDINLEQIKSLRFITCARNDKKPRATQPHPVLSEWQSGWILPPCSQVSSDQGPWSQWLPFSHCTHHRSQKTCSVQQMPWFQSAVSARLSRINPSQLLNHIELELAGPPFSIPSPSTLNTCLPWAFTYPRAAGFQFHTASFLLYQLNKDDDPWNPFQGAPQQCTITCCLFTVCL